MTRLFTRTRSGRSAKWQFYRQVLVWVEGTTDYSFYNEALGELPVKFQDAGGCGSTDLVDDIRHTNAPYVVVRDGDYLCLERRRSQHRRVVLLHRYASENYLFERAACRRVCADLAQAEPSEDLLEGRFVDVVKAIGQKLFGAVTLDVAARMSGTGFGVVPNAADSWITRTLGFRDKCISEKCTEARSRLEPKRIVKAQRLVRGYLRKRRLVDILRGHFAFAVLRKLIFCAVRSATRKNPPVGNAALRALLAKEVWRVKLARDHRSLRRRLRRAVLEAQALMATLKSKDASSAAS